MKKSILSILVLLGTIFVNGKTLVAYYSYPNNVER